MKKIVCLVLFYCFSICSFAEEINLNVPDLSGEWMEVANYPDFGVLEITQNGSSVEGRYVRVGYAQKKYFGFDIGDLVLKGVIEGKQVKGQVLLKEQPALIKNCPEIEPSEWREANFQIGENNEILSGSWEQQSKDPQTCKVKWKARTEYVLKKTKKDR